MVKQLNKCTKGYSTLHVQAENFKSTVLTDRINIPPIKNGNIYKRNSFKSSKSYSQPLSPCLVNLVDFAKKDQKGFIPIRNKNNFEFNTMGMITELTEAIAPKSQKEFKIYPNGTIHNIIKDMEISQNNDALTIKISLLPTITHDAIDVKILENACSVRINESTWKYTYPHHIVREKSHHYYITSKNLLTIHLCKRDQSHWTLNNKIKPDEGSLNDSLGKPLNFTPNGRHSFLPLKHEGNARDPPPRQPPLTQNFVGDAMDHSTEHSGTSPPSQINFSRSAQERSRNGNFRPIVGRPTSMDQGRNDAFSLGNYSSETGSELPPIIPTSNVTRSETPADTPTLPPRGTDDDLLRGSSPIVINIPRVKGQWFERDGSAGLTLFIKNCLECGATAIQDAGRSQVILTFKKFREIGDIVSLVQTYRNDGDSDLGAIFDEMSKLSADWARVGVTHRQSLTAAFNMVITMTLPAQLIPESLDVSIYQGNVKLKFNKVKPHKPWSLNTSPHILENGSHVGVIPLSPRPIVPSPYDNSKVTCPRAPPLPILPKSPVDIAPVFDINKKYAPFVLAPQCSFLSNEHVMVDENHVMHGPENCIPLPSDTIIALPGPSRPMSPVISSQVSRGYSGLVNLGNTCFMNCVIQILANTLSLRDYFLDGKFKPELNLDNPLGLKGELATAFSELINDLWTGQQSAVAPSKLKSLIAMKANQFSGYSQHDAQEFLAFLLDGLHEDLNRIKDKPYTLQVETEGKTDTEISNETWSTYMKRNDSFISDLFLGQYKSLLTCPECKTKSTTFDPLLYMTLPLPEKTHPLTVYFFDSDPTSNPIKFEFRCSLGMRAIDIIRRLGIHDGCDHSDIGLIEVDRSTYIRTLEDEDELTNVPISHDILAFRLSTPSSSLKQILVVQTLESISDTGMAASDDSYGSSESREKSYGRSPPSHVQADDPCHMIAAPALGPDGPHRDAHYDERMGSTCFGGNSSSLQASYQHQRPDYSDTPSSTYLLGSSPFQMASDATTPATTGSGSHLRRANDSKPDFGRSKAGRWIGRPFLINLPPTIGYAALIDTLAKFAAHTVSVKSRSTSSAGPDSPNILDPDPEIDYRVPPLGTPRIGGLMGGVTPTFYPQASSRPSSLTPRVKERPQVVGMEEGGDDDSSSAMETNLFDRATIIYTNRTLKNEQPHETADLENGGERPLYRGESKFPTLPVILRLFTTTTTTTGPSTGSWDFSSNNIEGGKIVDDVIVDLSDVNCISMDWRRSDSSSLNRLKPESSSTVAATDENQSCRDGWRIFEKQLDYENHVPCPLCTGDDGADEHTLQNCLKLFAKKEVLTPEEAWYCPTCKAHRQAEKTMCLWRFPQILIIIFKRFSYGSHYWREKLDKLITFPLTDLDLRDVYEGPNPKKPVYDLYGVINHHGTLLGGHYTSFARTLIGDHNSQELGWRVFDDSSVADVSDAGSVISPASYVLFYKLREG